MKTKKHNGTFFIMDDDYDYTTEIDKAVKQGDYKKAAYLERSRNAKIDYLGMPYEQTYKYQDYLNTDSSVASPASVKQSNTNYNNNMVRTLAAINGMNFKYDPKKDSLYKSMKEQAKATVGDVIADTMGTYSGMTGGMPSSYAVSAATQAGTQHLGRPDEMIPELYQLAYNKFANDKADLYKQYGIYADLENTRYARERDALADERNNAEWQYRIGRDNLADEKDKAKWEYDISQDAKNADLAAKESAYNRVMAYINAGMLPSQADIDASEYFPAGTTAQGLLDNRNNAVKNDLAMQAAYAPRSGGGSSKDDTLDYSNLADYANLLSYYNGSGGKPVDKTMLEFTTDVLQPYFTGKKTFTPGNEFSEVVELILENTSDKNIDVEDAHNVLNALGFTDPAYHKWLNEYRDVTDDDDDDNGKWKGMILK